jgi:Hemerythrin HHE cation binding domain
MSREQPIDVRDMAIIHRTFRAGYAEAAQLVRAAPTPSPERVRFLADHIDFAIAAMHIHHESEEELLYPKLIQRVPEQAPMTEEVEDEHQLVRTALDTASAALHNLARAALSGDRRSAGGGAGAAQCGNPAPPRRRGA